MKTVFSDNESHELVLFTGNMNPMEPARAGAEAAHPGGQVVSMACTFRAAWSMALTGRAVTKKHIAPVLEAVAYHPIVFNGSLTSSSVYGGTPSPGIDAAWKRITEVTELEVVHQLHCLTYPGQHASSEEDPGLFREHIGDTYISRGSGDHCIEMLRQQIMCVGDVGVITFYWVEGHTQPYPDFNTMHRCRDFEKILAWRDERIAHARLEVVENAPRLKEAP
ncbi:hypothetical protein POSPLADRAFT_1034133 [Postia placenta MAD-698-R-SB12]|uniref:Uncharacterized protein n=1 Tax=Postia placenta MAD-698-R-SB12 TaxID=670580 RepID=A0A1X6MZ49_9APHY|nr:hypothetical protein POSPLADRAFT_1034133 [Postia placenta MAD-698-R-SB12]OSX61512.1 hypothetical protein POSPLADRAFT_1034133 [Postia placenta MAD-698-R-SB12]